MHDCDSIALPQCLDPFSSYYLLESLQQSYSPLRSCYCLQAVDLSKANIMQVRGSTGARGPSRRTVRDSTGLNSKTRHVRIGMGCPAKPTR